MKTRYQKCKSAVWCRKSAIQVFNDPIRSNYKYYVFTISGGKLVVLSLATRCTRRKISIKNNLS